MTVRRQESAKYEMILQEKAAVDRFKSIYGQCKTLARSQNTQATDGELMAVCAYLAGKEFVLYSYHVLL